MRTLRFALLAAVAVGCHFDKLFQPAGGGRAPPSGSQRAHLKFTAPPHSAMQDSTIKPPVQVTALDSGGTVVTGFSGTVSIAIGNNGGVLRPGTLAGAGHVAAIGGGATGSEVRTGQAATGDEPQA